MNTIRSSLFHSLLRKYRRGKLTRDNIVSLARLYGMTDDSINAILAESEGGSNVTSKGMAVWDTVAQRVVSQRKQVKSKHKANRPERKEVHKMGLSAIQALLSDSKDDSATTAQTKVTCSAINQVNGKRCQRTRGLVNGRCWQHKTAAETPTVSPVVEPILPHTSAVNPAVSISSDVLALISQMEKAGISADYAAQILGKLNPMVSETPVNVTMTQPPVNPVNLTVKAKATTPKFARALTVQPANTFRVGKSKAKRPRLDAVGQGHAIYHVYGIAEPTDVGIYASIEDAKADGLTNWQTTPLRFIPRPESNSQTHKFDVLTNGKYTVYTAYVPKDNPRLANVDSETVVYAAW